MTRLIFLFRVQLELVQLDAVKVKQYSDIFSPAFQANIFAS